MGGNTRHFLLFISLSTLTLSIPFNPVVAQDTHQFLPPSSVNPFTNNFSFSVLSTNDPKPADWPGMDESKVFYRLLKHTQDGKDWTIKVGKGGQLYSIHTPQTGELIPMQREHGQWIDEVFQHVIPHNVEPVDGDIHQAGYYINSHLPGTNLRLLSHSLYSPLFNNLIPEFESIPNSISYITWPQHAHLPRRLKENMMIMQQNLRDMGDGVIEITLIISKWGGATKGTIDGPWSPIRFSNAPTQIVSNPDGSFRTTDRTFGGGEPTIRLRENTTSGWVAMTKSSQLSSPGIGFIFGDHDPSIEGQNSYFNWGKYDSGDMAGTVIEIIRQLTQNPGDQIYYRYYIVLGSLNKIQHYGNILKDKVELGKIETPDTSARTIPICPSSTQGLRRGCPNGQTSIFSAYRDFVRGSLPLFLMQDTSSGKYIVSSDPYKIDFPEVPYGKTKYIDFLGWAYPQSLASASSRTYKSLKNILTDRTLFPATSDDATLTVPTSSNTTNKPGDLNNDGKVNLADYNLLISGYGSKYNLSHYNMLISNYGK